MEEAGKSARTITYALDVVRMAFYRARDWGIYEGPNPATKVKRPQKDNRRLRFLAPEEAQKLLWACQMKSQQLYEMALLSLYCGLRAGEIFNLTWGDVDLKEGTLLIRDPKNRTNRIAYMTEEAKAMFKTKGKGDPGELVFKSRKGRRIKEVSTTFDRVVNALGLNEGKTDPRDRVVFHTLRHTFASWLAIQGTPLHVIKEAPGPQDPKDD